MLRNRAIPWLLGGVLLVGFIYGVLHLFALRFTQGDVYPPYSSLRADPLGTKALYEALDQLPHLQTARNYRPLERLKPAHPVTLLYAGVAHEASWGKGELRHLEVLVGSGSRAVFAFAPRPPTPVRKPDAKKPAPAAKDDKKKPKQEGNEDHTGTNAEEEIMSGLISFEDVTERWGVRIDRVALAAKNTDAKGEDSTEAPESQNTAQLVDPATGLEEAIPYRSAIFFRDLQPAWRVLYRVAGQPVLIERPWGDGTLVMVGDPLFLSNEALRHEPHPRLLARLVGDVSQVVFDEEHHGIRENIGIAALAQKYRLQGGIAGLLVVLGLAVWRSSVPFVRVAGAMEDDRVEGRDAAEAFSSLLRRAVAPSRILDVCLQEWRKSFSRSPREVAAVDRVLSETEAQPAKSRNSVDTYRQISQALHHASAKPRAVHSPLSSKLP